MLNMYTQNEHKQLVKREEVYIGIQINVKAAN